jgi:hypothetical protein
VLDLPLVKPFITLERNIAVVGRWQVRNAAIRLRPEELHPQRYNLSHKAFLAVFIVRPSAQFPFHIDLASFGQHLRTGAALFSPHHHAMPLHAFLALAGLFIRIALIGRYAKCQRRTDLSFNLRSQMSLV